MDQLSFVVPVSIPTASGGGAAPGSAGSVCAAAFDDVSTTIAVVAVRDQVSSAAMVNRIVRAESMEVALLDDMVMLIKLFHVN